MTAPSAGSPAASVALYQWQVMDMWWVGVCEPSHSCCMMTGRERQEGPNEEYTMRKDSAKNWKAQVTYLGLDSDLEFLFLWFTFLWFCFPDYSHLNATIGYKWNKLNIYCLSMLSRPTQRGVSWSYAPIKGHHLSVTNHRWTENYFNKVRGGLSP